ncbi:MAG TPA: hypothetical protein VFN23_14345, partial [Ktedonobacteraceae bacterium]|nr:hypothetical protein [Ktedonobacteraceae bacterium]
GPDHVDSHRTESLAISPYTSRSSAYVDHSLYDTSAMVRTVELILGLRPLSQYDANAIPMWRSFSSKPDLSPYNALPETIPVTQLNTASSFGANASSKMDFSQEDKMPMDQLNQVLWHAIKGANTPYPQIQGGVSTSTGNDG